MLKTKQTEKTRRKREVSGVLQLIEGYCSRITSVIV